MRQQTTAAASPKTPIEQVALYVATNLDSWVTDAPRMWATDVGIYGTCYRRLDPEYYAWIRKKVAAALEASDAGRLPAAAFEELRRRFNDIQAWAMTNLGEEALVAAVKASTLRAYSPPAMENLETWRLGISGPESTGRTR